MSNIQMEKITCPKCGKESNFAILGAMNIKEDSKLKNSFLSRDLFKFKCSHCGSESYVAYDFLYNDEDADLLAYLVHQEEDLKKTIEMLESNEDEAIAEMVAMRSVRIVNNANDLTEKIYIKDSKRDDRIIELMKALVAAAVESEKPELKFDEIRYTNEQNAENYLLFQGGMPIQVIPFADKLYNSIIEKHGNTIEEKFGYDKIIDNDWALKVWSKIEQ